MEAYLEKAQNLSTEQLCEFIKKKGNDRKKNLCDITKYQTEDYMRATDQHRLNTEACKIRGDQLTSFKQRQQHLSAEIQVQDNLIAELTKKMNQTGGNGESKQAAADQALVKLNNVLSGMNGDLLTKLSKYFEANNNTSLVAGIECLVALLRGHRTANNVDVELYLKDFEKLSFKLKRADVEHLTLPIIQHHKNKLQKIQEAFTQSQNPDFAVCGEYYSFIKWADFFCDYAEAQLVSNADKCGSDIVKQELNKAEQQKVLIIEKQKLWNDQGIAAFYEESAKELKERLVDYDKIVAQDEQQAKSFQESYFNFEKIYFQKLKEIVTGVQASTANNAGVKM